MNLASVIAAALALVDGEPILELVWSPARKFNGRASCHVLTAGGWAHLYGMCARFTLARSRRTDPFLEGARRSPGSSPQREDPA